MRLLLSPWRKEFESFLANVKHRLRIAAPYYGKDTIRRLLRAKNGVEKSFILALSDRGVEASTQSIAAIKHIEADPSSTIRLIRNLHAKVMIADDTQAIVTSANLTGAALDTNVELGVYINEPEQVTELIQHFDGLWAQAGSMHSQDFENLGHLNNASKASSPGKSYGTTISFAKASAKLQSSRASGLGWILIHTHARYGSQGQPENPMEEMQAYYKPGCLWHWKRGKPLKEGGPYRLLFAWEGKIFGEATAKITHDIDPGDRGEYDFAFKLQDYTDRKSVALEDLPLTLKQLKHHRDLIKLDEQILKKYDALIGSPSALELVRHYTFILDQDYSRSQIREQVGGNPEPYLPTVDGRVVCACLKTKLNGRAPEVILVGRGPGVERAGDILSQQATPIPVFIKRGPNRWTYRGMWRKKGSSQLPQDIEREADARQGTISRVIYMEPLNLPNES